MKRLGNKLFSTVLAVVTSTALLAGCGGGGGSRSALPATTVNAPDYNGPLADATLRITIPGPTTPSAGKRRPQYVSSATKSLKFIINSSTTVSGTATTGTLGTYNAKAWSHFDTGTLPSAACPPSGPDFVCTVAMKLPPGTDNVTFAACDVTGGTCIGTAPSGNVLSEQIQNLAVVAGVANNFGVTFDANAATMTVTGSGFCAIGTVANGSSFGSVGTQTVNFTVGYTDPATKTIVGPGLPKLSVNGHTDDNSGAGYTIVGTGGNVNVKVTQATQSYSLTPSTSATTATINVSSTHADTNGASDGLVFTYPVSYTFQTGPAPPATRFLAAVEQTGTNTGKVDFFNIGVDGGGQPASFSAYSPASLAVTTSSNDGTQKDVDNPVSLLWDNNGDLLIGNGGSSNNGNLACVPVGAIATGANLSTTVTQNIHDPAGLAYEPRNGTVAVGNNANPAGTAPLAEYLLTGNYTASTTAGATTLHTGSPIGESVINMPSLATGTFAAALSNGCEVDMAHPSCGATPGNSQIVLFNQGGITTTMTDTSTFHIDEPWSVTYDSAYSELIVANNSAWHPSVSFYTTGGTYQKQISTYFNNSQNPYLVAANGSGLFAVAYTTAIASDEVQIYTNAAGTGAPTPLFNPIPYDAQTDSGCSSAYVYGSSAVVTSLIWLSNTRLLVGLETGSPASANGYYIYDTASSTTPSQWDFGNGTSCNAVGAIPAQKGFQQITNKPFAAAYKP